MLLLSGSKNKREIDNKYMTSLVEVFSIDENMSDIEILTKMINKISEKTIIESNGIKLDLKSSQDYFKGLIERLNKRVAEYRHLLDYLQVGICVIDAEGKVTEWNSAIERLYGIKREDIIGQYLGNFFKDAVNLEVLRSGEKVNSTFCEPKKNCPIIINSEPIYYGSELIGVISVDYSTSQVQVLSDQLKIAEDTIKDLQRKLEDLEENTSDFFIGENKKVKEQVELATMVADTDVPIMIYGESGTGKEVFARYIHKQSGVKGRFVAVNCSAIPDTLFESEFFGYEKGAFTGASDSGKDGYFKQADSGTLFLDEISELPLQQQSKLLRAIQEGRVTPLGAEDDEEVNVRIVCATNMDLEEKVKNKEFRIDLYYRLKGIKIEIPPIREREEDIENMLNYFFIEVVERYNKKIRKISPEAMKILKAYHWPGNIREMKNVMRQMVLITKGDELEEDVIPREIYFSSLSGGEEPSLDSDNIRELGLRRSIEAYEQHLIKTALWMSQGNIAKASEILKIPRSTLHYRIEKYEIEI